MTVSAPVPLGYAAFSESPRPALCLGQVPEPLSAGEGWSAGICKSAAAQPASSAAPPFTWRRRPGARPRTAPPGSPRGAGRERRPLPGVNTAGRRGIADRAEPSECSGAATGARGWLGKMNSRGDVLGETRKWVAWGF